ncbi:Sushi, von Willebrand factor type A, EGF and pentraxin domain-containing protein 1 [Geodia barretti]|uniref:Sushi, von Willebrand factor type A, EGF and pentraxin domain-containing protein 1 n=1 Tax=Geodia barretti TaxID=519541 RepID=A0AA35WJK8_GEOBA|nr:Sushi, von Willebrand factor type A, EGF and pentraxin domain-containing protein 1 [Geodia barretti]
MASNVSYSGFQRLVVRCLCALALLQFPCPTESVDEKIELSCQNSDQSCEEILRGELSNPLPDCEELGHGNLFSYSIDNTQLLQPSITLTVNSSQIDTDSQDNFLYTGYVIGYRGCTNNPTEQCSSYIARLPSSGDNWMHIVSPKDETKLLFPEEQCTFFGCFLYTEENVYGSCRKRILDDIFVKNITILATCPHPGDSVENGSVSFTLPPVDSTRYVGGTVANVTCDEGFAATYGGVSECQSDGTWNTTVLPTCKRQCDELETSIDGGWIEISDITRTVHTTATVTCYDKYYIGGGNIICGENGNWSQSRLPQCNPAKCPAVQTVEGGDVEVNSPVSRYKPSEGFFLVNTTITVTCHEYYTGGGSITCGNGKWTSSLPLCFPVECLEPMADVDHGSKEVNTPHNGSAVYDHYLVNTTIRVSCDKGYIGSGSITCGINGNWTSPLPSCSRSYWPIVASVVAVTLTLLLIIATVFIFCCKICWTHRLA